MLVYCSNDSALHNPTWYALDGVATPCHEVQARVEAILASLADARLLNRVDAPPCDRDDLLRIHTPDYLDYLRDAHARIALADNPPRPAVVPDTIWRHGRRPAAIAAQAGWYAYDTAAPIVAGTFAGALASAGCACAAARAVLGGAPAAYALSRPPGHHAGADFFGGFCYLSNAALAADLLTARGRVALIDIDYHHGNGTQQAVRQRNDIVFVSLHADPNEAYPYFWGYTDDFADQPGAMHRNYPLPMRTAGPHYLQALREATEHLRTCDPAALVVSLGVDTAEHDPTGTFALNESDFHAIGAILAGLRLPTVFVQEGGYNLKTVGPSVAGVLRSFEQNLHFSSTAT